MADWFADLASVPDATAHAAFRARVQEILYHRSVAIGSLAGLQCRAMLRPNQPIPAKDALAIKGLEKAAEDARRLALVQAQTYHQGMHVSDVVAWERELLAAEAALALGLTKIQVHFAVSGSAGDGEPVGRAMILLAWTLCELPMALRILRDGQAMREAMARAGTF